MEKVKKIELIEKINNGTANADETLLIEKLIEQGEIELSQLESLFQLTKKIDQQPEPTPSLELDHRFYEMLAKEKRKSSSLTFSFPDFKILFHRYALACTLLIAGFLSGYWFQQPTSTSDVKQLTLQVEGLKEMMMISLLEKESATERLKAVSLTQEINGPSKKVTEALFKTLNADPNVNVRLAALDALQGYSNLPHVREGLVHSIATQQSPLVQMALAELMVAIQEKSSVHELKKVLDQKSTAKEVKEKIQRSINVLI
jgi:hypothetical protein